MFKIFTLLFCYFLPDIDLIRTIKDPEKPESLEELEVVSEDRIKVQPFDENTCLIKIEFVPTVPHCSLATLIGKRCTSLCFFLHYFFMKMFNMSPRMTSIVK